MCTPDARHVSASLAACGVASRAKETRLLVGDWRQVARQPSKLQRLPELHRGQRPARHARVVGLHLHERNHGGAGGCGGVSARAAARLQRCGARTVTEVIHGIQSGISALFCHISQASGSGTPGASTRALRGTGRARVSRQRGSAPARARATRGCRALRKVGEAWRTHVLSSQTAVVRAPLVEPHVATSAERSWCNAAARRGAVRELRRPCVRRAPAQAAGGAASASGMVHETAVCRVCSRRVGDARMSAPARRCDCASLAAATDQEGARGSGVPPGGGYGLPFRAWRASPQTQPRSALRRRRHAPKLDG